MQDIVPQDTPLDKPVYIYTLASSSAPEQIRYVGQTVNPQRRLHQHMSDRRPNHRGHWLALLRSQGLTPIMTVVEVTTSNKWKEREKFWVAFYRAQGYKLVNSTDGGDGTYLSLEARAKMSAAAKARKHRPLSEETKRKIGAKNEGRKASAEARARLSASHMGKPSPRKGVICSPETRAKMSSSKKDRPLSAEAKARLLANLFSPEANAKRAAARRGRPGRKHSPESVERSAAARRGQKCTPEQRLNMSLGRKRAKALRGNPPNGPTLWD